MNKWLILHPNPFCNQVIAMRRTSSPLAMLALALVLAGPEGALAENAHGEAYGNIVLHAAGGPKRIFVGASASPSNALGRALRRNVPVYRRAGGPAVISPAADPLVICTIPGPMRRCDAPIVLRGLGYRYGLDRDESAILAHPGCDGT
ncbi:MAG: hypothetical protein ACRECY_09120 [Phyllobacterium sp.]